MTAQEAAAEMLAELESQRLVVVKFPTEHDGDETWRRAAVSENPKWYQRMCARELKPRKRYPKPRTVIRRQNVLKALRRIVQGVENRGTLGFQRLRPYLKERMLLEASPVLVREEPILAAAGGGPDW